MNRHDNNDNVPSATPSAKPTTIPRAKPKTALPNKSRNNASDLSTETIIEMKTKEGHTKNVLGLLDTGAIRKVSAFIKRDALHSILHTTEHVNSKIQ
eukprot:1075371-Ditylum_brightwellii.AAC.1